MLKIERTHIAKYISILLLGIFTIGITPWEAFHGHNLDNEIVLSERDCLHNGHVQAKPVKCIVCVSHFDKVFVLTTPVFEFFADETPVSYSINKSADTFTDLIATSLRGPPTRS